MKFRVLPWITAIALLISVLSPAVAHDGEHHGKEETGWPGSTKGQEVARAFLADAQPAADLAAQSATTCTEDSTGVGSAAGYPCSNVDLLSFLPLADIGGGKGNDIWGWTDPTTGREYAIMGRTTGTAFVDITVPESPVYLGNLPTTRFSSTWRDIKVHDNHAFIVSESRNHGMQVFDLTRLRGLSGPVTFSTDAHYTGFATAHNIFINEDSGFAYAVGTNTCSGGLHMVNIANPLNPTSAGCFSADGYTHDVQCVIYGGPDTTRAGREICFASNEDTLTIVDVTTKSSPVQLARRTYAGSGYTHQGWLTDDQRYFLIDDELDESNFGHNTHTYVFDVASLTAPELRGTHVGTNPAIDHNQYIVGNHSFQANYRSGLRILDIGGVATASLSEVAYFDVYPADDAAEFNGAWSVYPFFASGTVVVSGIEQGLFVLRPNLGPGDSPPSVTITAPVNAATVSGTTTVSANASDDQGVTQVEFLVDGARIGLDTDGSDGWSTTWNTTLSDNGSRTLTAVATDTAAQTASDAITVNVDNPNAAPTASFTWGCANLVCDFNASASTDGDGTIATYAWDFDDGTTGTGSTISHSYSTGGSYDVILTVTDNDGGSGNQTQTLRIDGPTATMHVGDLDGAREVKGKSGRWEASVTITVHDGFEKPVAGATVAGNWSGALSASVSATTGSDGTLTLSTGTLSGGDSVTFTVTGADHASLVYAPLDNHDSDGGSDGTSITITRN